MEIDEISFNTDRARSARLLLCASGFSRHIYDYYCRRLSQRKRDISSFGLMS